MARSVVPSAAQARAQGLRGVSTVAMTVMEAASTSAISSSCAHATNTFESSALTSTPIGSEQTGTLRWMEAWATSMA